MCTCTCLFRSGRPGDEATRACGKRLRALLERWNAHACEIARTRPLYALCTRTARGTLPPAFDLESAEARALEHEHALLSNVLEARASWEHAPLAYFQVHAF